MTLRVPFVLALCLATSVTKPMAQAGDAALISIDAPYRSESHIGAYGTMTTQVAVAMTPDASRIVFTDAVLPFGFCSPLLSAA